MRFLKYRSSHVHFVEVELNGALNGLNFRVVNGARRIPLEGSVRSSFYLVLELKNSKIVKEFESLTSKFYNTQKRVSRL